MTRSGFTPTRTYPHPSCRLTHSLQMLMAAVLLIEIGHTGIATIVFLAAITVLVFVCYGALRRKRFVEMMSEDAQIAIEDASGLAPEVTTHPGWTALAVALDVLIVVQSFFVVYILGDQTGDIMIGPASLADIAAGAGAVAFSTTLVWLHNKAHRCATIPVGR